MNRITHLGELEQMVLLTVLRIGSDAYTSAVRTELAAQTGRTVARGAVYITLDRLVKKGYLRSRLAQPDPERGGQPNRFFAVTPEGRAALRVSRDALVKLWDGLDATLEER
jgi:DNA-binding PadR family transcriptional regulator